MSSQLGPSLAYVFICFHEQTWLNDSPDDFKPVYCRRYVDDKFILFHLPEHLEKFTNYLNSKHENIKLTLRKKLTIKCLFWIF